MSTIIAVEELENKDVKLYLDGTTLEIDTDGLISWEQLINFFGEHYQQFMDWMNGQTACVNGAYSWDVNKYIKGDRKITD